MGETATYPTNMKARELKALERIFSGEIVGWPLIESDAQIYSQLARDGYVERGSATIYGNGHSVIDRMPMKIEGWALTHKGRIAYCESCKDTPDQP